MKITIITGTETDGGFMSAKVAVYKISVIAEMSEEEREIAEQAGIMALVVWPPMGTVGKKYGYDDTYVRSFVGSGHARVVHSTADLRTLENMAISAMADVQKRLEEMREYKIEKEITLDMEELLSRADDTED